MDDDNSRNHDGGVEVEALTPSVDSSDRRTSLDRFRDVGKTVTQGISALREHLSVKYPFPYPPDASSPTSQPPGAPAALEGASNATDDAGTSDEPPLAPPGTPGSPGSPPAARMPPSHDDVRELSALLEAAGLRERNLRMNVRHLRAEGEAQARAAARAAALIAELRTDYDELRARARTAVPSADVVRLRTECVALEADVARARARAADKDARAAEERRKRAALERVCMRLRERVARAERDAQRARRLDEAVLAREAAEARLGEAKAEVEHLRVRLAGMRAATERAEVAEVAERALRARADALAEDVRKREDAARRDAAELRAVKRELRECRRTLGEKEEKIRQLVRIVGDAGSGSSSGGSGGSGRSGGSGGSARRRRARAERGDRAERRLRELTEDFTANVGAGAGVGQRDAVGSSTHSEGSQDHEHSVTSTSDGLGDAISERRERARRNHTADTLFRIPESSPLLRAVERTHAELQAVFQDRDENDGGPARGAIGNIGFATQDAALLERLRRFERYSTQV